MSEVIPPSLPRGTMVARILAVVAVVAFMVLVATLSRPQSSRATTPVLEHSAAPDLTLMRGGRSPAFLGSLEGQGKTIDVYMTRSGVRYTVLDSNGQTEAALVTIDGLQALFPELDFNTMHASSETQSASAPVDR